MGNDFSKGVDSAVSIITGIITGDMTGGLAGASAPWLAEQIKLHTGHLDKDGKWETDDIAGNLIAHAILGAVVAELQGNSALSGGVGAVSGELASKAIINTLYGGKDASELTEEEKQTISALSQLASGLAVAAGGGNIGDASAAISSSKNAVENNNLLLIPRVAWQVIRPSALGEPVTITAVDVLIARGLVADAQEAEAFLGGLTLEQRKLIELALVDPTGDENFENAVVKTYDTYYNEYLKKKASNKKNKTSDYASAGDSSTASGGANLQPDDDNDKDRKYKVKKPGVSGKDGAKDVPDWVKEYKPYVGENGNQFAKRILDNKYGKGNYRTGTDTEFSKIKKWCDRSFMNPK